MTFRGSTLIKRIERRGWTSTRESNIGGARLSGRICPPYSRDMYKNYAENAKNEEEYLAAYLAMTDALYKAEEEKTV